MCATGSASVFSERLRPEIQHWQSQWHTTSESSTILNWSSGVVVSWNFAFDWRDSAKRLDTVLSQKSTLCLICLFIV